VIYCLPYERGGRPPGAPYRAYICSACCADSRLLADVPLTYSLLTVSLTFWRCVPGADVVILDEWLPLTACLVHFW
jgi:hypothetical protein